MRKNNLVCNFYKYSYHLKLRALVTKERNLHDQNIVFGALNFLVVGRMCREIFERLFFLRLPCRLRENVAPQLAAAAREGGRGKAMASIPPPPASDRVRDDRVE